MLGRELTFAICLALGNCCSGRGSVGYPRSQPLYERPKVRNRKSARELQKECVGESDGRRKERESRGMVVGLRLARGTQG